MAESGPGFLSPPVQQCTPVKKPVTARGMGGIGVITLNCRSGINTRLKLEKIIYFLNCYNWQIALLQETSKLNDESKEKMSEGLQAFVIQNPVTPNSPGCGVATLIKRDLLPHLHSYSYILMDRGISSLVELRGEVFNIINVYIHTGEKEKKDDFTALSEAVQGERRVIIGGDLNSISQVSQRISNSENVRVDTPLVEFIRHRDLIDLPVVFNKHEPTYFGKAGAAMLDRFLAHSTVEVKGYDVVCCPFSDHSLVRVHLFNHMQENLQHRPKGTWKLNVSLLGDSEVMQGLRILWEDWCIYKFSFENHGEWWDKGKKKMKQYLIGVGIKKAREKRGKLDSFQIALNKEVQTINPNFARIGELKNEINKIVEYELEGARVRSRHLLLPREESGSKDFYAFESKNKKTQMIESIFDGEKEVFESEKIKNIIYNFYRNLYTTEGIEEESLSKLLEFAQEINLTDDARNVLNEFFTEAEIKGALLDMNDGKSPGMDGLPKEFYVATWDFLGCDVTETINNALLMGILPPTQREAQVRLLYKKGDPKLLKNWRPVSLLNADYKILSSALAKRLRGLLESFILPTQTCSVRGRHIFDNLRLLEDLIGRDESLMNSIYPGGKIISLDLEKAFDRLDHRYLGAVLDKLNLGQNITKWIKTLYIGISTRVMTPFGLTGRIQVTRSVRQGCPLSMILFVISADAFLRMIDSSPNIQGVKIDSSYNVKISSYADDTTIFLKNNRDHEEALKIINTYEKASGARCNEKKTQALYFGKYRRDMGIQSQEAIKILGIWFHHDKDIRIRRNWEMARASVKHALNKCNNRKVSMLGKVTFVNAFALSQLSYINKIVPIPTDILQSINKAINDFIFLTRPPGYANAHMARSVQDGGFGLPLVEQKCEAQIFMWMQLFLRESKRDQPWVRLFAQMGQRAICQLLGRRPKGSALFLDTKDTIYNVLRPRTELGGINWSETSSKELYSALIATKTRHFTIEKASGINWGGIWTTWAKIQLRNDWKILFHTVITNHFSIVKYYNRAQNCPNCNQPWVLSRDHYFMKCRGVHPLLTFIEEQEGFKITARILFYGEFGLKQARVLIPFVVAVHRGLVDKRDSWGGARQGELIARYLNAKRGLA